MTKNAAGSKRVGDDSTSLLRSATTAKPTSEIGDYALIGNCLTAALVGRNGSIDWLSAPRFDSPACFAALLGDRRNGRWMIEPAEPTKRVTRRYRPDTLILETTFETDGGRVVDV